jgi:8-oxo-dGTP diphosphatase|tara:strand:+ start:915 stop:1307 length:393 start_codon:yes stop_codon:yes gene_type:complete
LRNIEVAAGILIDKNKRILLAQRSHLKIFPLQWEFPGGKLEKSESIESALIRELKEELNIEIRETEFLMELKHDYDAFRVKIHFYLVRSWSGLAIGNESQLIQWYSIDQLSDVDLLAADTPVIKVLKKVL